MNIKQKLIDFLHQLGSSPPLVILVFFVFVVGAVVIALIVDGIRNPQRRKHGPHRKHRHTHHRGHGHKRDS